MNLRELSEKLVRNTIYNIGGTLWRYLIYLALIPYIVSKIGIEGFGVWSIIMVFLGYVGLFDLGFNLSFTKYISEHYARREYTRINEVVSTGFLFYAGFALVVFSVLLPSKRLFFFFFNVPLSLYSDAAFVFVAGLLIFLVSSAFRVLDSVLHGLQRMDVYNKLDVAMSFSRAAGVLFFLGLGFGLRGLVINEAIIAFITILSTAFLAKRLLPTMEVGMRFLKLGVFKELLGFGTKLQVSRLATLINFQFDKILISHFVGVGYVAFYELGSKVVSTARRLPLLLTSAVVPAASELDAQEQEDKVFSLYQRSSKYVIAFGLPLMLFALVSAPQIMFGWMGGGYRNSALIMRLLVVGYFANMTAGSISPIVQGIGKPIYQMRTALFSLSVNVVLSIFLIIKMGFWGAALGTSIAMTSAAGYYVLSFHRLFRRSAFESGKDFLLLPSISSIAGASVLFFCFSLLRDFVYASRVNCIATLVIAVVAFLTLHLVFLFRRGYLDQVDRDILGRLLTLGRRECLERS